MNSLKISSIVLFVFDVVAFLSLAIWAVLGISKVVALGLGFNILLIATVAINFIILITIFTFYMIKKRR